MKFIQQLGHEPIDIVGDVHGEIHALKKLIHALGYDEQGHHPEGRKLVFVGDLCDRGPDSVAVLNWVRQRVEQQQAYCILGNHELNLLLNAKREGNGWFFSGEHPDQKKAFGSKPATDADREWIIAFLKQLPIALTSDTLRIVHACWDEDSLARIMDVEHLYPDIIALYRGFEMQIQQQLSKSGLLHHAEHEKQQYADKLVDPHAHIPLLKNVAEYDVAMQTQHPVKVLTSGIEWRARHPTYSHGKWRMTRRVSWWEHYQHDIPVVIGHYWRSLSHTPASGVFADVPPTVWLGKKANIFCVDYSVGKRYLDRQQQRPFSSYLMALRWPEKTLVREDGKQYATQARN